MCQCSTTEPSSPMLAVSLFCQYLCSGVPVRSHSTCNCSIARDHTQVYNTAWEECCFHLQQRQPNLKLCFENMFVHYMYDVVGMRAQSPAYGKVHIASLERLLFSGQTMTENYKQFLMWVNFHWFCFRKIFHKSEKYISQRKTKKSICIDLNYDCIVILHLMWGCFEPSHRTQTWISHFMSKKNPPKQTKKQIETVHPIRHCPETKQIWVFNQWSEEVLPSHLKNNNMKYKLIK